MARKLGSGVVTIPGRGYKGAVHLPPVLGKATRDPVVLLLTGRTAVARMGGLTAVARHVATVDRKKHRVVDKTPTEISICVAGAREGTHIHMMQSIVRKAREKKKKYIYQPQKRIEENHIGRWS